MPDIKPLDIQHVVAIQNYGSSGTTLMHSLLDDHPQIISLPYLHGLALYQIWDHHLKNITHTSATIKKAVCNFLPVLFDAKLSGELSLSQMGDNKDKVVQVDKETFLQYLGQYLDALPSISRRDFIISVFVAYNACDGKFFDDKAYICYPIHGQPQAYAQAICEDFSNVRFLHMVREPVQNMGSIIKHINVTLLKPSIFKSIVWCGVSQIVCDQSLHFQRGSYDNFGKFAYLPDSNGVSSRYVRLEDVHTYPDKVMARVADWLGVEMHEALMTSTFMGHKWFNRAESKRVSGFNKETISQSHSTLTNRFDRFRMRLLSKTEQEYFHYSRFSQNDLYCYLLLPLLMLVPFRADFNRKRLGFRLQMLAGFFFSPYKLRFAAFILTDRSEGLVAPHEVGNISFSRTSVKAYAGVVLLFPVFLLRVFSNYVHFRTACTYIWLTRILADEDHRMVKPLYDSSALQDEGKP